MKDMVGFIGLGVMGAPDGKKIKLKVRSYCV